MINVLSYIGMGLQSEVCLWTLLGLIRTIFDATLFKVNANLKQVWQMSMPDELSLHVQRVLRTMISGVMLVQCFTVYVYLASYIVLLYPVFLEERPILLLPWLLLAAIRKLLCELTSLALGLGTCVLLGPARPPCIKFVVIKVISIMPSFYMWMLVYSYYHALKVASVFKTFPAVLPTSELNYGLELAIRRRRAKSLLGEDQLRKSLITNFYNGTPALTNIDTIRLKTDYSSRMTHATDTSAEELKDVIDNLTPFKIDENSPENENTPVCYEDWLGSEVMIPRDTDRILEQFGLMMLRISAYLTKEGTHNNNPENILATSESHERKRSYLNCTAMPPDNTDTPPLVANSGARTASYLRDYPQIFQKRTEIPLTLGRDNSIGHPSVSLRNKSHDGDDDSIYNKWANSLSSQGSIQVDTSSSKKSQSDTESNNIIQDKPSEKSVVFSDITKSTTPPQAETDFKQMSDGVDTLIDNCLNSQDSSKSIIDESNSQHYQPDNEKYPTKNGLKTKNNNTNSNQTLSESEIKNLSITSLEPSDEGIDTSTVDKATSTQHTKKRTKGLKKNKKQ